jgi:hypothetical protein
VILGNPTAIDAGIANVRDEVLPALNQIDGFVGLSMMVDRNSGRCIATSAWQDEETMRSSANQVQPVRNRVAEILGGSPDIAEWEVAVMHREHPTHDGAWVRSTWVHTDPENVERAVDVFRDEAMPQAEVMEGFCSASLLINRGTGQAVASASYESRAALDASREAMNRIRAERTKEAHVTVDEVAEFELVQAHLRVPELA